MIFSKYKTEVIRAVHTRSISIPSEAKAERKGVSHHQQRTRRIANATAEHPKNPTIPRIDKKKSTDNISWSRDTENVTGNAVARHLGAQLSARPLYEIPSVTWKPQKILNF